MPEASKEILSKIFGSILDGFFKTGFVDAVQKTGDTIIDCTIEIYTQIAQALRPTPARFHYVFNLRDVSKVLQGILMTKPVSVQSPEAACRLWVNEISRVFYDRLINEEDRSWFTTSITELVNNAFRIKMEHDELFITNKPRWGDLLKLDAPVKLYEEIKEVSKLKRTLENMLEDYNISSTTKMNLVFFDDCIEHILRIARILRQPRGNAMMIRVGGSGK